MTKISKWIPFDILQGVEPEQDETATTTKHYVQSEKIRFLNGFPEKIGGWVRIVFDSAESILGKARTIYSLRLSNRVSTIIGTHQRLYAVSGSRLENITPLKTISVAAANSLSTMYGTLGNNPITTTLGDNTIKITDNTAFSKFKAGDVVRISGATGFNGFSAGDINKDHVIRIVGLNNYKVDLATNATATGSGGGASVVRSSGIVTVTKTGHNQSNGDRVKLSGCADTGGILAVELNKEFIIRNVSTNTFDVYADQIASSSVSSAGGAGVVYFEQIPAGLADESFSQGYGVGLYGDGLYGVSKISDSERTYPRIYSIDRFGNKVILTPSEQTGLYEWDGNTDIAPTLITNAPTEINYAFVSDNIVVTFGADGVNNRIKASDINDFTIWTSSSTNQVFTDDIEGADKLISHAPLSGINLIFTETQTYSFRYIGLPLVWEIKRIDANVGIIAPSARVVVNGVAYWMAQDNFYMWRGGFIEVMESNSQYRATVWNYVFKDLNFSQKSKSFAWYNSKFNEIWFHYPSQGSNEPDRVVRYNIYEKTFCVDTFDRTAAEYPSINLSTPQLISSSSILYKHEIGNDADGLAMPWSITTNKIVFGDRTALVSEIVPDNKTNGTITLRLSSYNYPKSTATVFDNVYQITVDQETLPIQAGGRYMQCTISGTALGQEFRMGQWYYGLQESARR